uniref:Uncharacterized protein n=1 Tax=Arundo donax TaxID=35708 RepID=A0A0A9AM15_ARUDO
MTLLRHLMEGVPTLCLVRAGLLVYRPFVLLSATSGAQAHGSPTQLCRPDIVQSD